MTDAEGRPEGTVWINDLLAEGERAIVDIMEPEHEAVRRDDDQEQIAILAMQFNLIAVPVVDDDERLIGAVPPEALFRILRGDRNTGRFGGCARSVIHPPLSSVAATGLGEIPSARPKCSSMED